MKNFISIITFVAISLNATVQEKERSDAALIQGFITDLEFNAKVGETIFFENKVTNEIYETISTDSGNFQLKLPYEGTYLIKVKGFNDNLKYSELTIPKLKPEESGLTFQVNIQFDAGKEFILRNVYFDFGKASLTKESFKELDNLVTFMKTRKNEIIEIGGHTDNVGDPKDNKILSQKRAEAIVNYLVRKGIHPSRVMAVGYGEEFPIAHNHTEEGRRLNRRTEVKIITASYTK